MINYSNRLKKLQDQLETYRCDILLVEDVINIFYMTGIELSTGKLFIDVDGGCLFVDARYFEHCLRVCPFPVILLENDAIEAWLNERSPGSIIGFDSSSTNYATFLAWKRQIQKINKKLQAVKKFKLVPVSAPLKKLRRIKDTEEIALLRKSAHLGSEGFDFLCNSLESGVTEKDLAIELEIFWKRKGSKSLAFDPIIAFGSHGSMPHYRPDTTKLKQGNPVLLDIGVNLNHYHSDMTRVSFFGPPHKKMVEIYEVVREAQRQALALCKPGTLIKHLDQAARNYITKMGYGDFFTHNLGHGVGLEIHESPSLSQKSEDKLLPLEEGMVITIEPGIYLPHFGGVRLEDTVVITARGYENLTNRPV